MPPLKKVLHLAQTTKWMIIFHDPGLYLTLMEIKYEWKVGVLQYFWN